MKKVYIVHGLHATPNGGWRSWLMRELNNQDVFACSLEMSTPSAPVLSEWIEEIARHIDMYAKNDEVYLVGHSLGSTAILRYLESPKSKSISGVVLVSGPIKGLDRKDLAEFIDEPFNFETIKQKALLRTVIHGIDDDRVPFEHAEILVKELDADLVAVENGGHLNGSSGWNELPQVLEVLNKMMKNLKFSLKK